MNAGSPAISPHTLTPLPAARALARWCRRPAAAPPGCSGSYRCATASSARSMASVYWIRSLVPIERKSKCLQEELAASSAAAGHLDHRARPGRRREGLPASSQLLLARASISVQRLVASRSACASIGISRSHLAVGAGAQDRAQLRDGTSPARPGSSGSRAGPAPDSACARVAARAASSSGLSAPTSIVRIVTGRPFMPSTAAR